MSAKLPNSASTVLKAGKAVNVPVKVTNTGLVPLTYFADGRLNTTGDIPLAELSGTPQPIDLPVAPGIAPRWQVPPDVTHFNVAAVATTGVNLDLFYTSGNPDVYAANVNNSATVNVDAPQVSPGLWASDIGQTGPFDGPAPHGTFTISASARGQLFDPAVSSTTGDIWAAGVDPGANSAVASLLRQGRAAATKISEGTHLATSKAAAVVDRGRGDADRHRSDHVVPGPVHDDHGHHHADRCAALPRARTSLRRHVRVPHRLR